MAQEVLSWILAIPLLGFVTGLRSLTPMAVLCWFSYFGRMSVEGTWAAWTGKLWVAIAFTILAIAEYIGDKHPKMPERISPPFLAGRLILGGLMGAIVAIGLDGSSFEGILLGVIGALGGAILVYHIRKDMVRQMMCQDWQIAAVEDVFAVTCAVISMGIITA